MAGDTHSYDGKLASRREALEDDLERARQVVVGDKQAAFEILRAALTRETATTPDTLRYFDLISANSARGNYDPSNDLHADDILYLCYELFLLDQAAVEQVADASEETQEPSSHMLRVLAGQLHDMSTGACPPGRATRLFQVYISIADK